MRECISHHICDCQSEKMKNLLAEIDRLRAENDETIAQMSKNYQHLHHELAKTAEWCAELLRKNRGEK